MEKTKLTLGIDLGSTSTRATLGKYPVEPNREIPSLRFSNGDFSSSIYPFDTLDPVYLCEQDDPSRKPLSAKYAFYTLVDASDELLEQYDLFKELKAGRGDELFEQRLISGLEELFTRIAYLSHAMCEDQNYEIDIISLSVPSQWTLDFEAKYKSIILKTFGHQYENRIVFVYETEALGHYLCSEQWEHNIAEVAVRILEQERGRRLCVKGKRQIYDDFNKQKRCTGPSYGGKPCWLEGVDENRQALSVCIKSQMIEEQFDAAMKLPLQLARERIEELAAIKDTSKPRVVVSGGTAKHAGLKDKLRQMCEENNIEPPLFTDQWNHVDDPMKIAKGAAYAASNRITIEEFFNRGAAIGVQRQQHAPRGNNKEGYWDNEAVFALSKERSVVWISSVTGIDHLRLVCHPFYERQPPPKKLQFYRCYDLLNLGIPTQGIWHIALSLTGCGDDMKLVMERHYTHWTKKISSAVRQAYLSALLQRRRELYPHRTSA
ncbi:hypothetical protein PG999_007792 [Apiospora kogelbergensis]|uniref:Actin-like ATPase domain-containing protein n=1 Tax=Apiospora kogelbergensis TaxID=1337665 RepID=A0AAW0QS75_9PEZI